MLSAGEGLGSLKKVYRFMPDNAFDVRKQCLSNMVHPSICAIRCLVDYSKLLLLLLKVSLKYSADPFGGRFRLPPSRSTWTMPNLG